MSHQLYIKHSILDTLLTDFVLPVIWTMLPSNVSGRTKKSVTASVLFIAYCVGNSCGSQLFQASDAPRYIKGLTACAVLFGVEALMMFAWRTHCEFGALLHHAFSLSSFCTDMLLRRRPRESSS